ncbi:MAG: hypothetical protein KDM64_08685, partial [Verrucomicrobiae bacterium]|nr:hypothetical protein [Verrucomicrobiae bacterium]
MSFSFRNLFSQGKPMETTDAAESANWPPAGADQALPDSAGGNPFSSSPFSNVFSDGEPPQGGPVPGHQEAQGTGRPFTPNPLPTNRGTFEALFAGQGAAPAPSQPAGPTAKYSVREILPFLPPALVTTGNLPIDRTVEIPLSASGGGEVKLSAIQRVCPELFATEITPLNDSEVTLPRNPSQPPMAEVPVAATSEFPWNSSPTASPFGPLTAPQPSRSEAAPPPIPGAAPESAARPGIFSSAAAVEKTPAPATIGAASNPFSAPASASPTEGPVPSNGFSVGNPFSASASELAAAGPG